MKNELPRPAVKFGFSLKIVSAILVLLIVIGIHHPIHSSQTSSRFSWLVSTTTQDASVVLPKLIIYRRTPKTASTSMTTALLQALIPLGYLPIYYIKSDAGKAKLYSNLHNPNGKPMFLFSHNHVTRNIAYHNDVIIMDTFRDGYQQITSFCRHKRSVDTCDQKLIDCMRNDEKTLEQRHFRWAQHKSEDSDTFIDIPLSSEYPALSTTVLRTVFPNVVLELDHFRDNRSACPEVPELRAIYNELYQEIEDQVRTLRIRLLTLAGYPHQVEKNVDKPFSLVEMLDHAERMERKKYKFKPPQKASGMSLAIFEARYRAGTWTFQNGNWVVSKSVDIEKFERMRNKGANFSEDGLVRQKP